ncbi:respiratory nitrate reductase subunit gamma [Streptosporangium amethystogenes subsp. fukuiense]|uniref:Respiratory nitrate reductase subunit gamma n=1 Tax=Streptosporangium amethystogenes subsp. fukuiense TaxID=698418 RepID=A0ABW2TDZ3_9ACTN
MGITVIAQLSEAETEAVPSAARRRVRTPPVPGDPERRGLAIGVFGAGMGGTAISALTTVKLVKADGAATPFLLTAAGLAVYTVVAWFTLRDAPGRTVPTQPLAARLAATAKLPITWQACILYTVAFGGYMAFSVYLQTTYVLEDDRHRLLVPAHRPVALRHLQRRRGGLATGGRRRVHRQGHRPPAVAVGPAGLDSALLLFAVWPFTRLVHMLTAPVGYLTRPYVVYRSRDEQPTGARAPRRGWEPSR